MFIPGVISTLSHKTAPVSKFTQASLTVSTCLEFKSHNCQMVEQEIETPPPPHVESGQWEKVLPLVCFNKSFML